MKKWLRHHKAQVLAVLLFCSLISIIALGYATWTLLAQRQETLALSSKKFTDELEINFLWKAMVLNGVVEDTGISIEQKAERLELIAKNNTALIQDLSRKLNKYSVLFGNDWYTEKSQLYTQFAQADFHDSVLVTPSLRSYNTQIDRAITDGLGEKHFVDGTIEFQEFDNYRLVLDSGYVDYMNTVFQADISNPISIYAPLCDTIIQDMAKSRGYLPKKTVEGGDLINDPLIGYPLTSDTSKAFLTMQEGARQQGIEFTVISGYRGLEDQKTLLTSELDKYGFSVSRCSDEVYVNLPENREKIEKALNRVAPPGYSRHTSGIALDLSSPESRDFSQTAAFRWLSNNNYYNAKKYGFMPSYPTLAEITQYGPNPEAWEYFYVGSGTLDM